MEIKMSHAEWTKEDVGEKEKIGYVYGVEYGHHLGNDLFGVPVYPSIRALYESMRMNQKNVIEEDKYPGSINYPQDGIVKVRIEFLEHIKAEDCWKKYEEDK